MRYIGRLDSLKAADEDSIEEVRSIIKSYRRKNLRVPKAQLRQILAPVKEEDSEDSQESAEEKPKKLMPDKVKRFFSKLFYYLGHNLDQDDQSHADRKRIFKLTKKVIRRESYDKVPAGKLDEHLRIMVVRSVLEVHLIQGKKFDFSVVKAANE